MSALQHISKDADTLALESDVSIFQNVAGKTVDQLFFYCLLLDANATFSWEIV